jgi:hypothetical protein
VVVAVIAQGNSIQKQSAQPLSLQSSLLIFV